MRENEAIDIASKWIRDRYPVVPPVANVFDFTKKNIQARQRAGREVLNDEEIKHLQGKWFICFACSWDTDSVGMPRSLSVEVDDETGHAKIDLSL